MWNKYIAHVIYLQYISVHPPQHKIHFHLLQVFLGRTNGGITTTHGVKTMLVSVVSF